ncbi:MAG: hypothetical protein ACREEE_05175, partial [Dongiaceae bacterium]
RIAIIGNAGGGKSTLARKLAERRDLPLVEIDALVWQPGWKLSSDEVFDAEHGRILAEEHWLIDGLGNNLASIATRLERATEIILIDMPLWMDLWLLAERQIAWAKGELENPPGGIHEMVTTEDMFSASWEVERDWMPEFRRLVDVQESRGTPVRRIASVEALNAFSASV